MKRVPNVREAMVEWMMFEVDLWNTDSLSSANIISVPALDVYVSPTK